MKFYWYQHFELFQLSRPRLQWPCTDKQTTKFKWYPQSELFWLINIASHNHSDQGQRGLMSSAWLIIKESSDLLGMPVNFSIIISPEVNEKNFCGELLPTLVSRGNPLWLNLWALPPYYISLSRETILFPCIINTNEVQHSLLPPMMFAKTLTPSHIILLFPRPNCHVMRGRSMK